MPSNREVYVRTGRLNTADPTADGPDRRLIEAIAAATPGRKGRIRIIGTSAAWIVLAGDTAWKCRRATRRGATLEISQARRRSACGAELALNQRFSPAIYHDLWSLCVDPLGRTHLIPGVAVNTGERPIETVLRMQRLESGGFLEHRLRTGRAGPDAASRIGESLLALHTSQPQSRLDSGRFVRRFSRQIELCAPLLGDIELVGQWRSRALALAPALEARVRLGQVIDSHGDLRPAHLHLDRVPATGSFGPVRLIDALDCSPLLRQVDPWEELSLLALLAADLGAAWFGPRLAYAYHDAAKKSASSLTRENRPNDGLLAFYTGYHALIRARLAAAHLRDQPGVRTSHWQSVTRRLCSAAHAALAGWHATG